MNSSVPFTPGPVPSAPAKSTHGGRWVLAVVFLQLILLYVPTIRWLLDRWTMGVWYNGHGLLIPPIVTYFIWQELRNLRHLPPSSSSWGFAILIPALIVHALDTAIHTQLLAAASLVLALPGLSLLLLGRQRTQQILFPLVLLALMLPIPLALTEPIHLALREVATAGARSILPLLGVPVLAEGTTLHVSNASLLVSDACSGFATLYAALAVACLAAYSTPDWRRRVLVLFIAAPLAILANVLRVVLLVLLVRWQGSDVLATSLHPLSGMLTFALVLPAILWVGQGPRTFRPATS